MEINSKIISIIRISLCLLLLVVWSFWIFNLPGFNNEKSKETFNQNIISIIKTSNERINEIDNIKKSDIANKTESPQKITVNKQTIEPIKEVAKPSNSNNSKIKLADLPKLANLELIGKNTQTKKDSKTIQKSQPNSTTKDNLNVNLPKFALATREALQSSTENKKQNYTNDTELRNKIVIDKGLLMIVTKSILEEKLTKSKEELDVSWLPKYIIQKKELDEKVNSINNSLEKIISQLELVGIINNDDGNNAVIIKNKSDNKTEILKIKDEYQGLKITEINNDGIKLTNTIINKSFFIKLDKKN